ncbi:hypothetical protein [Methylorubrum extorquens]|uniref:hypothetical protein n=1 Tax=Methylorubrum extorquens TaxID=408 RepID=UPI00015B8E94|nr:hypothetical protein [Methylorubrum extorquens]
MPNDNVIPISQESAMMQKLNDMLRQLDKKEGELKTGTIGSMASDREYVDLKLEATEARTEARFVEMNGKLDRILDSFSTANANISDTKGELQALKNETRDEYRSTRSTIIITTISTAVALAALLMGIVTYGDAIFGRGMSVRDVVSSVVKEQADKAAPR